MALISFNDGAAADLSNDKPAPANRFAGWTPIVTPFGGVRRRASDGRRRMFVRRTDYGASLQLVGIPVRLTAASSRHGAGVDLVAIATRLIAHLKGGGVCSVACEDTTGALYANCGLWADAEPSLALSDRRLLEYTLSLQLLNLDAAQMICRYR